MSILAPYDDARFCAAGVIIMQYQRMRALAPLAAPPLRCGCGYTMDIRISLVPDNQRPKRCVCSVEIKDIEKPPPRSILPIQ